MIVISPRLKDGYKDFCYLLDRGYPKQSALNFIANHFQLTKQERFISNRMACSQKFLKKIRRKIIINPMKLRNNEFNIDFYNHFTTFQSLVDKDPLIKCRDGFIRDMFSILHSKKYLRIQESLINKYLEYYLELNPRSLVFYFDKQRSHSQIHLRILEDSINSLSIKGEGVLSSSVDHELKTKQDVIIFSHDSIIIGEAESSFNYFSWLIKFISQKDEVYNQILYFDV